MTFFILGLRFFLSLRNFQFEGEKCEELPFGINLAHLELNHVRKVKDNKNGFFKYIKSKRSTRENMGPLLNEAGALVAENTEKAVMEHLHNSVFTSKSAPRESPGDKRESRKRKIST